MSGERFDVRACAACGLRVTSPWPRDNDSHYPVRYRTFGTLSRAVLATLYDRRVEGWLGRLGGPGAVLDIGCGEGWMLRSLSARGWRAFGTERSIASLAAARDLRVYVGDTSALAPNAGFDLIILFHVIEHLADPVGALAACAAHLRPGGRLIIAAPNYGSWQSRVFRSRWAHLDVPRHLLHFDHRSLRVALERAGLRIERTTSVSLEHDPYGWVEGALESLGAGPAALKRRLVGMDAGGRGMMAPAVAVLLFPAALVAATVSWLFRAGAVMEVWAVRR